MDFITKLLKTSRGYNTIRVMVDRLTKYGHLLLIKEMDKMEKLAITYLKEIIKLHGVLISTIFD